MKSGQAFRRGDKLAGGLRPVRGNLDGKRVGSATGGVEEPDVGSTLEDDPRPVGLGMPHVEAVLIREATDLGPVGPTGIQVSDALEVRDEIDAVLDPHRARDVPLKPREALKGTLALGIDPQMSGGSAAIALPARGIGRVASDHTLARGPEGQMVDLAELEPLGQACVQRQDIGPVVPEKGLTLGGHEKNLSVRREPPHHDIRPQPGHAARRPALRRHEVDLGVVLVTADVGDVKAVSRQDRR